MDLCGLEQQVKEVCPELSGNQIIDEFICIPFQRKLMYASLNAVATKQAMKRRCLYSRLIIKATIAILL